MHSLNSSNSVEHSLTGLPGPCSLVKHIVRRIIFICEGPLNFIMFKVVVKECIQFSSSVYFGVRCNIPRVFEEDLLLILEMNMKSCY